MWRPKAKVHCHISGEDVFDCRFDARITIRLEPVVKLRCHHPHRCFDLSLRVDGKLPSMNQLLDTCSSIKYHPHEFQGHSRIGRIKISLVTHDLIGSFKL